jgi:GrpB-like predicted nucleotidyltransferase (UPF0157 family)
LYEILGQEIIKCEHFGSTSVEGMKAKPVIDMMVIVRDITQIDTYNSTFKNKNYDVAGEWGIKGRRLLRKGGENRTHHIHIYQFDNLEIDRHLKVRDYLRAHKQEVNNYNKIKEEITKNVDDTKIYRDKKHDYVKKLEERAIKYFS